MSVGLGVRLSSSDAALLAEGRHPDPFSVLGPHRSGDGWLVRACLPGASYAEVALVDAAAGAPDASAPTIIPMRQDGPIFEAATPHEPGRYRLRVSWPGGVSDGADPYAFAPLLTAQDLHLFAEGRHFDLATRFGANPRIVDGEAGAHFAVWAPNASAAGVVGDFNGWNPARHPMRLRHEAGVWEIFIPGVAPGALYKFALRNASGEALPWKADPLGRQHEAPPRTGSMVAAPLAHDWQDSEWMARRRAARPHEEPMSVYEVHVGSWLRGPDRHEGDWDEAADRLVSYLVYMGFTHVELLPVTEHPFGGSWGYQPTGMFAPTSRYGPPEAFARFIDACHRAGVGVILDWVPAHFPSDEHGLARFDGTALYEHEDPRQGFHRDWNTLIYNFGRSEVRGFLLASALWWIRTFHIDGLRVDAVASMLYRDYSRPAGEWVPNHLGGRENLEAVSFLQELTALIHERGDGAVVIAEESTAWPGVTAPPGRGGLGFDFKWNMGWMHDTLRYFGRDPVHRRHHGDDITFGLAYAYSERFVLPVSHDEVVHGKRSLLGRMPGDAWRRFANLRLFLALMWTHPGKKLLFMGCEFGQETEWDADGGFPWPAADDLRRRGAMALVRDLNRLHRELPALHLRDHTPDGFAWVIADDAENSVFAFLRRGAADGDDVLAVANMTPTPRSRYRIGVSAGGVWRERLNSDAGCYGGSNTGNGGAVIAEAVVSHGYAHSLSLSLPPLGLLILDREPKRRARQPRSSR